MNDTVETSDADRQRRYASYDCSKGCPVEAALEIIGGKWKGLALYHLMDGPVRFNALRRELERIPINLVHSLRR